MPPPNQPAHDPNAARRFQLSVLTFLHKLYFLPLLLLFFSLFLPVATEICFFICSAFPQLLFVQHSPSSANIQSNNTSNTAFVASCGQIFKTNGDNIDLARQ
jgi:hypothetical protein